MPTTVLEAMATPLYEGQTKYLGTAFDLYALDTVKPAYAGLVMNTSNTSSSGTNIVDHNPRNRPINLDPDETIHLAGKIESGQEYTIVAIARRDDKSNAYAFCAYYPIEDADKNGPMIISAVSSVVRRLTKGRTPRLARPRRRPSTIAVLVPTPPLWAVRIRIIP